MIDLEATATPSNQTPAWPAYLMKNEARGKESGEDDVLFEVAFERIHQDENSLGKRK